MNAKAQFLTQTVTRFQRLEAVIEAHAKATVEADIAARKAEAASGHAFYQVVERLEAVLAAAGQTLGQFCKERMPVGLRTYQLRRRLHDNFSEYASKRREVGNSERCGFAFALELISVAKPQPANLISFSAYQQGKQAAKAGYWQSFKHPDRVDASDRGDYPTPHRLFQWISRSFGGPFDLDVCADAQNTKVKRFFTLEQDALKRRWIAKNAFMNPPFSRPIMQKFLAKGRQELAAGRLERLTCLLPIDVTAAWFQWVEDGEITLLRRRIKFDNTPFQAPFGNMIVVLKKDSMRHRDGSLDVRIATPFEDLPVQSRLAAD
jgi:phage N-6-adenine-methyltransferase